MTLPVRTRLTAIYCTVFCLGAAVLETGAYTALKIAISAIADRDLNSRLTGVQDFLGEHLPRLNLPRLQKEIRSHAALQPDLLRISPVGGPPVFAATALDAYAGENFATPPDQTPRLWTAGTAARPLRVMVVTRTINGAPYHLWLAADLTVAFDVAWQFALALLLTSPFVIGLAAFAGHWVAGRALAPVLAITRAARSIDAADLSRRIAIPESHDELRFLAETLNGMLARIERSFRQTVEFTASASHELRTPLAVIRATAEVALMRPGTNPDKPTADRAALQQILKEAERNTALLEDLLRLARADSGAVALRLKPVNFAESVRTTCRQCEPLAARLGVRLTFSTPPESWVSADAEYMRRLLLILLDNALKYTPAGGSVDVRLTAGNGAQTMCSVRDTGIGIAEADLPRIFERFFRSDRARSREEGGAGLGLAIAEWIARTHQGTIEVESAPGQGSEFRIVLPTLHHPPLPAAGVTSPGTVTQGKA